MSEKLAPRAILVAALGGEGGGTLADWIVSCAIRAGYPAQSTSVPGVAQRTGATSYYIEYLPGQPPEGLEPVFALVPSAGRVDFAISSELLESGRLLQRGFITPERTTFISSSSRALTVAEKMQMGDGRVDPDRIHETARALAQHYVSLDLEKMAQDNRTIISATMFGALAGAGAFSWPRSVCEDVIREGKRGVEASLSGFAAAFDAVQKVHNNPPEPVSTEAPVQADGEFGNLPADVRAVIAHGADRTEDFQDKDYRELYLSRVRRLVAAAPDADDPRVSQALEEGARRLALWMAYEDIPRVADLKTRASRFERISKDVELQPGQVLKVVEYLKPGGEEIADMLPEKYGNWIMKRIENGKGLPFVGRGMHVSTTGVVGYQTMRFLSKFARIRRKSLRYQREQAAIEEWLGAMEKALRTSPEFAGALAELPRVLKGYGETHARGKRNYGEIFGKVVQPSVQTGDMAGNAQWLRNAVAAALADPESQKLDDTLAAGAPSTEADKGSGNTGVQGKGETLTLH